MCTTSMARAGSGGLDAGAAARRWSGGAMPSSTHAIGTRHWFDPWVFELDEGRPRRPKPCCPWVAGFATALELFPGADAQHEAALLEPLALALPAPARRRPGRRRDCWRRSNAGAAGRPHRSGGGSGAGHAAAGRREPAAPGRAQEVREAAPPALNSRCQLAARRTRARMHAEPLRHAGEAVAAHRCAPAERPPRCVCTSGRSPVEPPVKYSASHRARLTPARRAVSARGARRCARCRPRCAAAACARVERDASGRLDGIQVDARGAACGHRRSSPASAARRQLMAEALGRRTRHQALVVRADRRRSRACAAARPTRAGV